jgi:CyaY protein
LPLSFTVGAGAGGVAAAGADSVNGPLVPQADTIAAAAKANIIRSMMKAWRRRYEAKMVTQGTLPLAGAEAVDEREFNALADTMLGRIEQALEQCNIDFDYEVKPGGVLELEFADGSKIIINRHTAAREIWVAAKSGGFHFRPQAGAAVSTLTWSGTRDGEDLLIVLARCMGAQSGTPVTLNQ